MLEKALSGSKKYYGLIALLLIVVGAGFYFYLRQLSYGLGMTGMSRDVSWGLYISQFTFLAGVAVSMAMVILPLYLHNYKAFGKIAVLGEFLAVACVVMSLMFIVADLGLPARALNVLLYPTPSSILFWDMLVLNGYLLLSIVIGWTLLASEQKSAPPPTWIKPPPTSTSACLGTSTWGGRISTPRFGESRSSECCCPSVPLRHKSPRSSCKRTSSTC